MKVHLIRHAESVFNKYGRDEIDCDLSETGIEQAKNINLEVKYVICSPLKRTRDTLKYSNIKYEMLEINNLCREMLVDKCDFMEDEKLKLETVEEITNRVIKFRDYLLSLQEEIKEVLVITHRDFIYHFGNLFGQGKKVDNTEILTIDLIKKIEN